MHSILPHQHHDELGSDEQTEEYAQADGLIDYLQLIFNTDLGDGHLEYFENGADFEFDFEFTVDLFSDQVIHSQNPLLQKVRVHESRIIFYEHDIPILKKEILAHLDFRGPPSIV